MHRGRRAEVRQVPRCETVEASEHERAQFEPDRPKVNSLHDIIGEFEQSDFHISQFLPVAVCLSQISLH